MNLKLEYEVSDFDIFICKIIKKIKGKNKSFKYIERYSKRKYGEKNSLSRYFVHKYFNIAIGKYTYNWEPFKNSASCLESIGSFCSIAFNVSIAEGKHPIDYVTTHPITYNPGYGMAKTYDEEVLSLTQKIVIGNDVWIGRNAVLLPGIKIGNGAIIGAGAIVIKDVPDFAIVAGVPAKIIRYRFTPEKIELLNKIKWWNWDDSKIKSNIKLFSNPEKFIETFKGEA